MCGKSSRVHNLVMWQSLLLFSHRDEGLPVENSSTPDVRSRHLAPPLLSVARRQFVAGRNVSNWGEKPLRSNDPSSLSSISNFNSSDNYVLFGLRFHIFESQSHSVSESNKSRVFASHTLPLRWVWLARQQSMSYSNKRQKKRSAQLRKKYHDSREREKEGETSKQPQRQQNKSKPAVKGDIGRLHTTSNSGKSASVC